MKNYNITSILPQKVGQTGLRKFSLSTQFMMVASGALIALTAALTYWTAYRVERATLSGAGTVGALYLQTFVAPLIDNVDIQNRSVKPILDSKLRDLLGDGPVGQHVKEIKIWQKDGSLLYSTSGKTIEQPVVFPELAAAFSGEIVVTRTEEDRHNSAGDEKASVLIEVYAPLWKDDKGNIALVGEFYEEPEYLIAALENVRYTTFLVVGVVTIPLLAMLYLVVRTGSRLIVRQRATIEANLQHALALSEQNNRLRLSAEYARLEAGKLNEKILDQIGCDLHDGPLQVLTLIKLRLSDCIAHADLDARNDDAEMNRILGYVSAVISDLRTTSAGLVLPELDEMALGDAIRLSVERYSDLTGQFVDISGSQDDISAGAELNVCAYRFTQEALMNAFRHAPGKGQRVRYKIRSNRLVLFVADLGQVQAPHDHDIQRVKLGRISQKRRVRAYGGRMRIFRRRSGTIVAAVLPINPVS